METDKITAWSLTEAGKREFVRKYQELSKLEATDDLSAYSDDFMKIEDKAFDSEWPEVEVGSVFTKSGCPEFIALERSAYFESYEIDA